MRLLLVALFIALAVTLAFSDCAEGPCQSFCENICRVFSRNCTDHACKGRICEYHCSKPGLTDLPSNGGYFQVQL
ncbi:unnamed protein product [Bursaphelenchus xylophilus]|uniref:(pine wood nematode) hypothetical protein n=1 Tax=Bursaphelenchus xylophilus TaxID=6326 RepID=A0A1I7SCY3_BURXY|nr:unnamed protein product [Bursaphelenchus xylophilus]CAG9093261.1 unnamed protein product [Bursaphelenchus xylophilus]